MWPKINKDLLPMKGHYFLNQGGVAPVQSFMPVYVNSLGFSKFVVGSIYFILPIAGMLAKPLFGAVADRFRLHKFLFIFFQIVTIISFFNIQFISHVPSKEANLNVVCNREMYFHVNISKIKDRSKIDRVMDESETNETLQCRFRCDLTEEFHTEICHHWRENLPFCWNDSAVGSLKNLITEPPRIAGAKSKLLEVGKDVYTEKYKTLPSMNSIVNFKGFVSMKKTVELKDMLYFRVSKILFEKEAVEHFPNCLQQIDAMCNITCNPSSLADLIEGDEIQPSEAVQYYQFWVLLLLLITSWVGMAVVGSISDAICFEMLGAKGSQYGRQRLWGSIGWGMITFLAGLAVDHFSKGYAKTNYTPIFYFMLILLLGDVACMYSLKYHQTKLSTQIIRNVGQLLMNIRVDIFLIWCICIGFYVGFQWNFLYLHIGHLSEVHFNKDKEWEKTLQGSISAIQCLLGELPSFLASGWLLKKFGHVNVMCGILFFTGIRFILYSFLTNPWWCLPIEILQSAVALSFATMASYASIVAPPGTEATVQGLVGATFEGVGVSLGSLIGGIFYDTYGGAFCFRYFGIAALIAFVLHTAAQYFLNKMSGFKLNGKGDESRKESDVADVGEEEGNYNEIDVKTEEDLEVVENPPNR